MRKTTFFFVMFLSATITLMAQQYNYPDIPGKPGFTLVDSKSVSVEVQYAVPGFSLEDQMVQGMPMKHINLPGTFLFNNEGMPNLPGNGRYIAIPEGAIPHLQIVSMQTEILHNIEIAPAPRIPTDIQPDFPLQKNQQAYSTNAYYPESPAQISEVQHFRGIDVVMLGITPFQYNPVTKDLIVYKDLKVKITFEAGNGQNNAAAYRSLWWDPIMQDNILNQASLPVVDYNKRLQSYPKEVRTEECEYIIISPTGPSFLAWADTIRRFRTQQGILTKVYTVTEVGGNTVSAIEAFIDNAFNTWTIKPVACLLLGDYGTDGTKNIISYLYNDHPDGYNPYPSDNKYADVNGDEMPDVVFSRILANDAAQLQVLITKFLDYERNPPTDPLFYDKPISALGWQTERWFQLCSEIVGGYFKHTMSKHPRRINAIYDGTPGSTWSSASNTSTITNYFGPNGLAYIPAMPSELGGWTGGTATKINQAIDSGAFMLVHRDHGLYTGWGEPAYSNTNIGLLNNTLLPFVFSINCQTGAYHRSSECFGEKFLRHTKNGHNAGALGMVCPSEVSYSFVNDTFVWGMFDNMFPDFMPAYGTTPPSRDVLPAFGNAAGKYFLKQSNWPYGGASVKPVTYRLFHMLGDAFQVVYTAIPQQLTVIHDTTISFGALVFPVQADEGSLISITVEDELIATATGVAGVPVNITIPELAIGTQVLITITKQNFFRYHEIVPVISGVLLTNFSANTTTPCSGSSVNYSDISSGSPIAWTWVFQGGTPATSTEQNPTGIAYDQPGNYDVTLTASKATGDPVTLTKTSYIHVVSVPVANFEYATGCVEMPIQFADQSNGNGGVINNWNWNFGDPVSGVANTSSEQNPTHIFTNPGTYTVSLEVKNEGTCGNIMLKEVVISALPATAATPAGNSILCSDASEKIYTTAGATDATTYHWTIDPESAGTIEGTGLTGALSLASGFTGSFSIKVQGSNDCGDGAFSEDLPVTVIGSPTANFEDATGCAGQTVQFADQSITNGGTITDWTWNFGDPDSGAGNTSSEQNPSHIFTAPGIYHISLEVKNNGTCSDVKQKEVVIISSPAAATKPTGEITLCKDISGQVYTTAGAIGATSYSWAVSPENAGVISGAGTTGTLALANGFTGSFSVKVQGSNECGKGVFSEGLPVTVTESPAAPAKPLGVDSLDVHKTAQNDFTTSAVPGAITYSWFLTPETSGSITGSGLTGTAIWNTSYRGHASVKVKAVNACGESLASEEKPLNIYSTLGLAENNGLGIAIFPNPSDGKFSLDISSSIVSKINLVVFNTLGMVVYTENDVKFQGTLHKTIDLTRLPQGVYHLKVTGDGVSTTIRVVIGK
ncbi:MAG: C25 family cysteine peptidase [Bacteroidetes bacterium]|nr:C25 family cysteine peptidase [Bacteroidota bacterium]